MKNEDYGYEYPNKSRGVVTESQARAEVSYLSSRLPDPRTAVARYRPRYSAIVRVDSLTDFLSLSPLLPSSNDHPIQTVINPVDTSCHSERRNRKVPLVDHRVVKAHHHLDP